MRAIHEHEFEAAPGLPAPLPRDEHVLWQGSPDWKRMAVDVFHIRKIALYFLVMLVVQWVDLYGPDVPWRDWVMPCVTSALLAGLALMALALWAWLSARTTLYTITDRRVVMRVGIVLSLTFNLPHKRLLAADLRMLSADSGDIALKLPAEDQIGFFHLWPHAKGLEIKHPMPTMRCVPDAHKVGDLLVSSWRQRTHAPASLTTAVQHNPVLQNA